MADNPGSRDRSLDALDFIINVIKEHEQNLDKSIQKLASVIEKMGDTKLLDVTIGKFEEKINNLQKELTTLTGYISNSTKEALQVSLKKQEPHLTPSLSATSVQEGPTIILCCKQWVDFQALALNAKILSYSYKEEEKVFHVDAIKGNKIITYKGTLPNISLILKVWLSRELDTAELNILEGFLIERK